MDMMPLPNKLTLAGFIAVVEADAELPLQRRRNLCSSMRKFACVVGGSMQMEASFPVFRNLIGDADIAAAGVSPTRWSNIRSDMSFVLKRYGAATRAPLRGHLSAEWAGIRDLLDGNEKLRRGLSSFIHWCNAEGIKPVEVDSSVFDRFLEHLRTDTLKRKPEKTHQNASKLWNEGVSLYEDWPRQSVAVPRYRKNISFAWDEFPAPFRNDVDAYLRFMGGDHPTEAHCAGVPRKPTTLENHRHQIRRFASALVRDGYVINDLTSLSDLVAIENFRRAVRYYHDVWLGEKRASLFEMVSTMVVVAQEYVGIDGDELEELKSIRNRLKCRERGMTDKNRNRLRPLLSPQNQIKFLCLPDKLLKTAGKKGKTHRSALLVQTALIHEILIHAPLRLANLVNLNINRHIKRVKNGARSQLFIVIPADEVKNQEMLDYELPEPTVRLFDRYMSEYRPLLLKRPEDGWLFPGEVHGHKHEVTLRGQLCKAVEKHAGLKVNPHLYRHIAAFFYLQAHPGDYETVRRLLGHRSVDTTMNFYAEFDGLAARRLYSQHILERKHDLQIEDRSYAD